mmetsp:Transcript_72005/g.182017  ORF Transcript_72005/g.182017 Transcript_72005/m.182017 type:complete len:201 (+) Transcript_72005:808-1410(+)
MYATQALNRSCASEKPTCLTARSATWRAFSRSLIFKWNAMYRIHTIEVSPSVNRRRSKSSTLRGSLANRPSATSTSRFLTSSAAVALAAFFCRFDNLLLPALSSSSSSSSWPSSSSELSTLALKSAKTKEASPSALACFPVSPATAAARCHGASSSESAPNFSSGTGAHFLFLPDAAGSSVSSAFADFLAADFLVFSGVF